MLIVNANPVIRAGSTIAKKKPLLEIVCPKIAGANFEEVGGRIKRIISAKCSSDKRSESPPLAILLSENAFENGFLRTQEIQERVGIICDQLPKDRWISILFSIMEMTKRNNIINNGYVLTGQGWQSQPKRYLSGIDKSLIKLGIKAVNSRGEMNGGEYNKLVESESARMKIAFEETADGLYAEDVSFLQVETPNYFKIEFRICADAGEVNQDSDEKTVVLVSAFRLDTFGCINIDHLIENQFAAVINDGDSYYGSSISFRYNPEFELIRKKEETQYSVTIYGKN